MIGSDPKTTGALDLLWGAESMAPVIGRTPRQVHNMLVRGLLPARKIGTRWVITRDALIAFFTQPDQKVA